MFAIFAKNTEAQVPAQQFSTKAALGAALKEREGWDIRKEADLEQVPTPRLVATYNHFAEADADLGYNVVSRFSSRPVAISRVMGMITHIEALAEEAEGVKHSEGPSPDVARTTTRVQSTTEPKQRTLKNKRLDALDPVYDPKAGSVQEAALTLLQRTGGIDIDEFITEMNKVSTGRVAWSRGNTWASLVTILHTNKGWGLEYKDGVLSAFK